MWNLFQKLKVRYRMGRCGQYVDVGGIRHYYEIHGHGEPLLLFHGGLSSLETFRYQVPDLSCRYQVILPERRGHGRTPDAPGEYSYSQMAEDMIIFMDRLKLRHCKLVGYSDGANLILHLVLRRPDLAERIVLIAGNYHHDGCEASHQEELRQVPPGRLGPEGIDERYARISPDGAAHYVVVYHKLIRLWLKEPTFTPEDLTNIRIPALVMAGEKDVIKERHTLELARRLPLAECRIIPQTTHRLIKEAPKRVNAEILKFLKK